MKEASPNNTYFMKKFNVAASDFLRPPETLSTMSFPINMFLIGQGALTFGFGGIPFITYRLLNRWFVFGYQEIMTS